MFHTDGSDLESRGLSCGRRELCRHWDSSSLGQTVAMLAAPGSLSLHPALGSRTQQQRKRGRKHRNARQVLHLRAAWFAVTSLPTLCSPRWLLLPGCLGKCHWHQHLGWRSPHQQPQSRLGGCTSCSLLCQGRWFVESGPIQGFLLALPALPGRVPGWPCVSEEWRDGRSDLPSSLRGCSAGRGELAGCSWAFQRDDIKSSGDGPFGPGTGNKVPPVARGVSGTELSPGSG